MVEPLPTQNILWFQQNVFIIGSNYLLSLLSFPAPQNSHSNIFASLIERSSINGKIHLLQLNLDPAVSAFEHRAWSVTHTEGMQFPERVTFRRYQKCWGRPGITQQSSSDFVRMRIRLPLANSLVSGQSIFSLPSDCAPGTRLDDQMSPLWELRVPPQALDPTRVFLCSDYIEITGSCLILLLLLLQKGWVGYYSSCQNLCPKSTKPQMRSGSSTHANIFMQLLVGFDFQIEFREQSFNTAAFKKQMRRSICITEVYLTASLFQYSPSIFSISVQLDCFHLQCNAAVMCGVYPCSLMPWKE